MAVVAAPTGAFELSGGVSAGGVLAGTVPRFAVGPHAGVSWRLDSGFHIAVRDLCDVLPAARRLGVGVYNQTSGAIGYAGERADFSVGPSLSAYSLPACGGTLCGRVVGVSPGLHAQVDVYLTESAGLSATGGVDWLGGRSRVLPGGAAGMVVVGPVFRWRSS
jgi:hypothetical protein